jgi:PKD repeat protein
MNNKKNISVLKGLSLACLLMNSTGASAESDQTIENQVSENSLQPAWMSQKIKPKKVDIDLRGVQSQLQWEPGQAIKDMPRRRFNPNYIAPSAPKNAVNSTIDQLMASQKAVSASPAENARVVEQQFDGSGFTGVNPPDPTGDVGLNYYIQSINGSSGSIFTIYDKETGSLVSGPTNMETLGSGNCASGAGDPIILFDEMANRWLLSEFSSSGNNLCVYISQTSNPVTGGWYSYAFASPTFPDYPKYGVGVDAYYVGTNESTATVYALDRNAMLAGNSAGMVRLTTPNLSGFGFQMLQPVDHDGVTDMPAGTPGYFLRHRDDEVHNSSSNNPNEDYVELWQFDADFNNTANSSFTKVVDIPVAEFDSSLCGLTSFSCFPQSGSSSDMDPLREVVMFRAQYRNFGSYETIVGNFVTDVNGNDRGGIRWFELRRSGANWTLEQEGTYSPDSKNRWMGSIAMDKDGNTALAYSWGSSTDFPGLRYTGRLANDANGTMSQPETILVNGTAGVSSNRWGDYSHLALDPVDGCTFWYTNEYGKSNGQWGTHISSFKFDSCGGTGGGNNSPSASFSQTCNDLACDFDGSASSDSDGSIASYSWDFGDGATATGATPSHSFASAGTYTVQLTVTDNQGATGTSNGSVVVTSPGGGGGNELENGVAVSNLSGTQNDEVFYTFEVPAGATDLSFVIAGGTGDADLYVRFGSAPTTSTYDCRPYVGGNNETCAISNIQTGTYHVMLRAYSTYSGVSLTASYTIITNQDPVASFTDSCTDLNCDFDGNGSSDSDGSVSTYSWDFGDGATASGANASHNYASAGTYTVTLTVTDNDGATNSTSSNVTVTEAPTGGNVLTNGTPVTGIGETTGSQVVYTFDVPAGATNLSFVIAGGSGDADLYAKFGSEPTTSSYDCRPYRNGNNETCDISNVQTGTYYVMIRAYSTYSGLSLTASYDEGGSGGGNGGSFEQSSISGSRNSVQSYSFEVPAGMTSLTVVTTGGSGDADMYVRQGTQPTTSVYDCRPYNNGNEETCTFTNPASGTWYVDIRGYTSFSGVNLTATWNP